MCARVACNFNACKPHTESTDGAVRQCRCGGSVLDHHTYAPSTANMTGADIDLSSVVEEVLVFQ